MSSGLYGRFHEALGILRGSLFQRVVELNNTTHVP